MHQFSKIEMFILCKPEDSDKYLEELIGIEDHLFSSLGLHYKYDEPYYRSITAQVPPSFPL